MKLLDRRFRQHRFFLSSVVVVAPAHVLVRERERACSSRRPSPRRDRDRSSGSTRRGGTSARARRARERTRLRGALRRSVLPSRKMPRHERKPCSGCGRSARIASHRARASPRRPCPPTRIRDGVHSACARCALGMCSVIVVKPPPRTRERRCARRARAVQDLHDFGSVDARPRPPRAPASTCGTEYRWPSTCDVVVDVDASPSTTRRTRSARSAAAQRGASRSPRRAARRLLPYRRITRAFRSTSSSRDARVEGPEREEHLVADAREQPPLRDLHGDLDLRLVARSARARRQHRRAVVLRHLLVRALHPGLVPARARHAATSAGRTPCARGTPPKYSKARTWLAIQSGPRCEYVASAYVRFDAPSTATKSSTSITSPVAASTIRGLLPE